MTFDNSHMFRPLIEQTPGQPDPTSGDAADLAESNRPRTLLELVDLIVDDACGDHCPAIMRARTEIELRLRAHERMVDDYPDNDRTVYTLQDILDGKR